MKERKVGRKIEGEREKGKWREGGRGKVYINVINQNQT